jgi:16S rRNA processing protein RimM
VDLGSAQVEQSIPKQQQGLGAQERMPEPRFLAVGRVVGAHGLRGELKVEILTDDPHRFGRLEQVFLGLQDQEPVPWTLEGYRLHAARVLLKLGGCDDRASAQALRGYFVQVRLEEAIPLDEDEYFEHQILGLDVWTAAGEPLGTVVEILYTGANDVYVVRDHAPPHRETLIPAIEGVVLEVDLVAGRMEVELPEGLV